MSPADREHAFPGYRELEPGASEHLKCVDVNNLCADWASRGECQRNPGYMLEKCPLSCHACDEGEGRATPAAEEGLVANRLDARSSEGTVLVLTTSAGALRIRVRPAASDVAGAIQKQAPCTKCAFYRAELPADLGSAGPPYGLLQGRFASPVFPAKGPALGPLTGDAALGAVSGIPGTGDWFVHLQGHPGWAGGFVELGHVLQEDMALAYKLALLSTHEVTHPDFGTKMRMLDEEVPFRIGED